MQHLIKKDMMTGKMINNLIRPLGIQIYRIPKGQKYKSQIAQDVVVLDPIGHNSQEKINEYYSSRETVDLYLNDIRRKFYKIIIDLTKDFNIDLTNMDVADVGCGPGYLFVELNKLFTPKKITGYEYSIEAIKRAKSIFPKASYELFDIYQGTENKHDVIYCTEVIEHLLNPDIALKQLLSMLKPGGTLILTVPDGRRDNFLGHINFWSPESWKVFVQYYLSDNFSSTFKYIELDNHYYNCAIIIKK